MRRRRQLRRLRRPRTLRSRLPRRRPTPPPPRRRSLRTRRQPPPRRPRTLLRPRPLPRSRPPRRRPTPPPVWISTSPSGAPDNSSRSHFSAMTRPSWLGRAVRNRHRHAIEQATRRWRGGRRDDSARTRRKILISTQARADLRADPQALGPTDRRAELWALGATFHRPFRRTELRSYQFRNT